jgi:hypothetical protein
MSMTLVSTVTVGSGGAASIDFNSIPQTGTDLVVVISSRLTDATVASDLFFYINNSNTGAVRWLQGTGSATRSNNYTNTLNVWAGTNGSSSTSNTFSSATYYFPNYTSTTNKSFSIDNVTENNAAEAYQSIVAGSFATSSPITSLKFNDGTYAQHSTASLYLITKGSGGATTSP